jgi:hypothetical protein
MLTFFNVTWVALRALMPSVSVSFQMANSAAFTVISDWNDALSPLTENVPVPQRLSRLVAM